MTERRCIFAWTADDNEYPEYLNVSVVDGKIKVIVRGPKRIPGEEGNDHPFTMPGRMTTLTLPDDEICKLIDALMKHSLALAETQA
jgi:hypothetical protein